MQSILPLLKASPLASRLSSQLSSNENCSVDLLPSVWQDTWALPAWPFQRKVFLFLSEVILALCALHFGLSCAHILCLLCNISSSPLGSCL